MSTDETREALLDVISALSLPNSSGDEDLDPALAKHEAAIRAEALRWASGKLLEGIWPEGEERGVKNAARELKVRAAGIESEARG
jgi:hypothetical protein